VDLVEQRGDLLHLVEDHRVGELRPIGRQQPLAYRGLPRCGPARRAATSARAFSGPRRRL
jgi:hypothetical protein